MASLTVLKGPNPGQKFELNGDEFILGRDPKYCQIHIANNAVSRQHAKITRVQNEYYIEDLESRNGTWVNNQEIKQRTALRDTDRIKICDCLFTFHDSAPQSSAIEVEEDETDSRSTVHASVARMSQQQFLETQPSDRLRALLKVGAALGKTLHEETLLPQIADILFEVFRQADRCFIIMRESAEGPERLIPKVIKTRRANTEMTARFSKTLVRRVLDTGQSLLFEDAQDSSQVALSASIAEFRIRSVMCAPLMAQDGNAYGLIQLDTQDRTKSFTQDDLNLLVAVANQAGVALDNARLHRVAVEMAVRSKDEQLARDVQRSFLPAAPPELAGYQFYAHYQAAKNVGGDYYDFVPHANKQLAVLLGDVAGKGMPAALLMAKLSAEARYCLLMHAEINKAIHKLNGQLMQAGMMDRFVTLSAALLDPVRHAVTFASAGHESPLVYRRASHTIEPGLSHEQAGFPLGMFEEAEYGANSIELSAGDCVLIFTDGVTDALDVRNESFGMHRVREAILAGAKSSAMHFTPQAIGERVVAAVQKFAAGQAQNDDIALVCFGRCDEEALLQLEPPPDGVADPTAQTVRRRPPRD